MNNQINNSFNYNWNAYQTSYQSSLNYSPVMNSPLSPMTSNYAFSTHNYKSPSLSSGYCSENSFNNSPSVSNFLPPFNYNIQSYSNQYLSSVQYNQDTFNLSVSKPHKRSRTEIESDENRDPSTTNDESIINIIQNCKSAQQKPKRTNTSSKKRKLDEQIESTSNDLLDEQLDEFGDDNDDLSDISTSLSTADANKKKRILTKTQRLAANQRERKRMNIMNDSFQALRQALPISTGRKRRKMSRLDIVCGALEYIAYLEQLLESDGPYVINFEAYQNSIYFYD